MNKTSQLYVPQLHVLFIVCPLWEFSPGCCQVLYRSCSFSCHLLKTDSGFCPVALDKTWAANGKVFQKNRLWKKIVISESPLVIKDARSVVILILQVVMGSSDPIITKYGCIAFYHSHYTACSLSLRIVDFIECVSWCSRDMTATALPTSCSYIILFFMLQSDGFHSSIFSYQQSLPARFTRYAKLKIMWKSCYIAIIIVILKYHKLNYCSSSTICIYIYIYIGAS